MRSHTDWRSVEQLADDPKFREFLEQEFPDSMGEFTSTLNRRRFITLMGASLAMAGLACTRRPVEKIVPYVSQPEEVVPGIQQFYATTMPFGLSAYGLLVESREGRPTKIEGNSNHPATLGRSNAIIQAEILNLYDPDRSDRVIRDGAGSTWSDFVAFWREMREGFVSSGGAGLAVLSEQFSSPTLARLRDEFLTAFPNARFVAYEPINDENMIRGISAAAGGKELLRPDFHYDKANIILSLDCDFLSTESENITAANRYAAGRHVTDVNSRMNRLYVVEPDFTITGASADHRLRIARSQIGSFALALLNKLQRGGVDVGRQGSVPEPGSHEFDNRWLESLAGDLIENRGKSLIVGGRGLSPETHGLIAALNAALDNIGKTVSFRPIRDAAVSDSDAFASLVDEAQSGKINTLIILGGNPCYNAPVDLDFVGTLEKIKHTIHMSLHKDETSDKTAWHLPRAHFLEQWGDARAFDGTLSVIQPLIEPLYGGRSDVELMDLLVTGNDHRGYDIVRDTWRKVINGNFEQNWRRVLHDGVHSDNSTEEIAFAGKMSIPDISKIVRTAVHPSESSLELTIQPSPSLFDGRYSNNGWLQELPHPITKLTWDNAACVSPTTADQLRLKSGDIIELSANGATVEAPVWIVPGQADFTVSVTLGYGRTSAGQVGNAIGFDSYRLRSSDKLWFAANVKLVKTGRTYMLASTQDHGSMEGRPIVRKASLQHYREHPQFAREMVEHPPLEGIYKEHDYSKGYQWGMVIDLNACIGCNACVIACQSENNIPVVGKDRISEGREMHWIRLDRYFSGEMEDPDIVFQPVACQHCENAPCEAVCPVQATSHDREGLNVMTYNRCIGTRYCSNNCPYKVRRFNFFNYTKNLPETVKMAMNPDVTVRSRGVMEKCTFCTQRINRAKSSARTAGRTLNDGEIVTACQQACPMDAITFGNINDPKSMVSIERKRDRGYELLGEFNTKPRNSYLALIRNPNKRIDEFEVKQESERKDEDKS